MRATLRGRLPDQAGADQAYAEVRDQIRLGSFMEPAKATVASFLLEEWLPRHVLARASSVNEQAAEQVAQLILGS